MFLDVDAAQVEINPFGETPDGRGAQCDVPIHQLPATAAADMLSCTFIHMRAASD